MHNTRKQFIWLLIALALFIAVQYGCTTPKFYTGTGYNSTTGNGCNPRKFRVNEGRGNRAERRYLKHVNK